MTHTTQGYDAFDRSNGNGSASGSEDLIEEESIYTNEWGSSAATTFNPADTDAHGNPLPQSKQQKFEDLYALNNGRGEKSRRQDIRRSKVINDTKTFMSVAEIPQPLRERILHIVKNFDISSREMGGRRYEKVILAICSLVSDEELTNRHTVESDLDILDKRLYNKEEFQSLMDTVNMSGTEYRSIRNQVRQKSDYF